MFDLTQKQHMLDPTTNSNIVAFDVEYVSLPSEGYFYKGEYKGITKLLIKKLSYIEENMFTTKSFYDNETLYEEILKSVIVDKNFPVNDLVEIDKLTILWWLRIEAFGREWEIQHTCPNPECKKKIKLSWDLGTMTVPDFPPHLIKNIKTQGKAILHIDNNTFEIIPPTYSRRILVDNFIKIKLDAEEKNKSTTKKLLTSIIKITEVDGKEYNTIQEIYIWLKKQNLSLGNSRIIQNTINEVNLTVDTSKDFQCNSCGQVIENVSLPMSLHFFGLNSTKYREYLLESINYLHFWGKVDLQSLYNMSISTRKHWINMTEKNLKLLYGKK